MILSITATIGSFLFQSAASGIVGEAAYEVVSNFYQNRNKRSLVSLYTTAFKRSVEDWKPTLTKYVDANAIIQVEDEELNKFLQSTQLEIASLSDLTEVELARSIAKRIEKFIILPGHQLNQVDLEDLAMRLIRHAAELFVDEISRDEYAFRTAILQEARLAAFDRDVIVELIGKIPIMLKFQIDILDKKIESIMMHIKHVLDIVEKRDRFDFESIDSLVNLCQMSVFETLSSIPKFNSQLYVSREAVEWEFSQFLSSDKPCALIQGEAGVGKTNILYHLARNHASKTPTLFFKGTTQIVGRLGFSRVLADELSALAKRSIDPAQCIQLLDTFLEQCNSQMIIFIDAINENRDILSLREGLGYAVQDLLGTRIKLCLSCRDVDWRLFESEGRLVNHLYEPKRSSGRISQGVFIEVFSEQEFIEAWDKYRVYYQINGDINQKLRNICRHPLMLQFLCDSFKGRSIPPGIHRKEIFDRYWKEKISDRGERTVEPALYNIVSRMLNQKITELGENEVIDLVGVHSYKSLLSEQVIIYTFRDQLFEQNSVGFTYEAFLEYTLARYFRQKWNWINVTPQAILKNLQLIAKAADEYRVLHGVLIYLLLSLNNTQLVGQFLVSLAIRDTRWKIFFCDIQTKLDNPQLFVTLLPRLLELARDTSPQVRWAVGNALGHVSLLRAASMGDYTTKLAMSSDWREREVAAFAAGYSIVDLLETEKILILLADDINWRVRRAVGYALNNLCLTNYNDIFQVLYVWSKSRLWRVRQAVAKSQKGLYIEPKKSLILLSILADDSNEEVRWLTVISLISLAWKEVIQENILDILMALVNDENYFVRKQIATLTPDLYRFTGKLSFPILLSLGEDRNSSVRWELARALGRMTSTTFATDLLETLSEDENKDVQFAALFSRTLLGDRGSITKYVEKGGDALRFHALREKIVRASHLTRVPKDAPDLFNTWKGDRYSSVLEALEHETHLLASPEQINFFFDLLRNDGSEGVRWALASVLSISTALPFDQKVQVLLKLTKDLHYWVRREAITSLQQLIFHSKGVVILEVISEIPNWVLDENPEVRYATLKFLLTLNTWKSTFRESILTLSKDDDIHVRELAYQALINIGAA